MLCRGGSSDLDKDIVQRWPKRFKVLDVAEFPKSTENTGARIVGLELQIDETTIVDRAIDTRQVIRNGDSIFHADSQDIRSVLMLNSIQRTVEYLLPL